MTQRTFHVGVREVHVQWHRVEAGSAKEAIEKVREGEGEIEDFLEYSHTLTPDTWTAEEVTPERRKRSRKGRR